MKNINFSAKKCFPLYGYRLKQNFYFMRLEKRKISSNFAVILLNVRIMDSLSKISKS